MPQWTPGPWLVMDNWYIVTDKDRTMVATTSGGYPKQTEANARLIALAPEMVEALRACVEVLAVQYHTRQRDGGAGQQAFDRARELLARLDA